jgi:hypothetical protein
MAWYNDVDTTKKYRLGTRKRSIDNKEFIYLVGVANTVLGSWVSFDGAADHTTALLDSDVADTCMGRLAVAQAAVDATTKYGWYQIYGLGSALALTAFADGKCPNAVSTAGSVDDGGGGLEITIIGAKSTSAVNETTLLASFALAYPFMPGVAAD